MFVSFLDYSKTFDKISYWKLFHKLLDDKVDTSIVRLLVYWYSNQQACVRWHDCLSDFFYPNVTTLRSGLCCRNSVCRLSSVCVSVVCRL